MRLTRPPQIRRRARPALRLPRHRACRGLRGQPEALSNAQRHGRPPATVRIWATPGRIVVTVHDTGPGPADRLAGPVPAPGSTTDRRLGLGLWVMHELDIDVTLRHAGDGFTVRLRGGTLDGFTVRLRGGTLAG